MCGIAGIVSQQQTDNLQTLAQIMASALSHRGPDDSQISCQHNLAMIHRRLAIQDLSTNGRQPMNSHSGRYSIVFNGEIYNFLSLRQRMVTAGHEFVGGSDTEVLLAAFEELGIRETLHLCEGMFAFVLIDNQTRELHLCRDRLGEKPLYYCWNQGYFAWSSELKAIKRLPFFKPQINQAAVASYLRYGYITAPESIYQNCYKLVPGTLLTLKLDELFELDKFSPYVEDRKANLKPEAYWDFADVIKNPGESQLTRAQAVDQLDELLSQVVTDQLIADVPTGTFLSGGIDSSLVTSVAQSLSNTPIDSFTIGFKEKDYDEAPFAKKISEHLGTHHHELYISANDCLDMVPQLPSIFDEPFADSSALPAYFVSKLARQKVTVCLSGDAGDELFCGYNRYTKADQIWKRVSWLPRPLRTLVSKILLMFPPSAYEKVYSLLNRFISSQKNTRVGLKAQKLAYLLQLNSISDVYEMLVAYCQQQDAVLHEPMAIQHLLSNDLVQDLAQQNRFIEQAMAIDTITYLPDDNLTKVDRTSMAHSLETRLPLLNHKVVEFAWQLPLNFKTENGVSKSILRELLYKRVPRSLIERPKMGFSVPIADWLRTSLFDWAYELLTEPDCLQHGFFDEAAIMRLWNQHQDGKRDNASALWAILMFQSWYRKEFS